MAEPATTPSVETGPGPAPRPGSSRSDRAANAVIGALLRLGAPLGPMALLTVPGRVSGEPRSTPVAVLPFDGGWRISAPFGVVDWVRNLRAAGAATIRYRGATVPVSATELAPDDAAPLLCSTMADAGTLTRRMLAPHFAASLHDTEAAWVAEAHDKPVFRLAPSREPADRGGPLLRALTGLLVFGLAAQIVLAGLAAFGHAGGWSWHRTGGVVVEAIALGTAIAALASRRAGARWLTMGVLALITLQHGTASIGGGLAGGVHAVNAIAMLGMVSVVRRRLRHPRTVLHRWP